MPILTPDERIKVDTVLEELALSINDAIVATTVQQKTAAKTRFKAAMKAHGLLLLSLVRAGTQGEY